MTDKPTIKEPAPEPEEDFSHEGDEQFYNSTSFWNQLRLHYHAVACWDVPAAAGAAVIAALLIKGMVPVKYMAGMVQESILPMIGIVAVFIVISLMGIVAHAFANDKYALCLGLDVPETYSGLLFVYRWCAVIGVTTIIAGCFVYLASYAVCWPYLIFLFLFFYTLLTTATLFGTLACYGMFKYRYERYLNREEEADEEKTE